MGVCSGGCPGDLGFAPVKARCGGGTAAWDAGVLAAPGTRDVVARAAGNTVFQKGMATCIGLYAPVIFPGEPPSLTEKPGRPQSTGLQSPGHDRRDPACIEARLFFGLWQLCPSESCM